MSPTADPQRPPLATAAYRVALVLAAAYAVYVVVLKLLHRPTGGPLGDVGEFLLVLAAVCAFAIGLFADESARIAASRPDPNRPQEESP